METSLNQKSESLQINLTQKKLIICSLLFPNLQACIWCKKKENSIHNPNKIQVELMTLEKKSENYAKVNEVKAVITLRGGKQVDQPMPKSKENKGGEQAENVKEQEKWK